MVRRPRAALDGKTANVIATLRGTVNPELVYVVSSHFDSVEAGPGADDDTSGTAALLEAARVLAGHPMPATIVFASFTGEEGGLLGSREFVRRARAGKMQVVGALNNDMIGWTNDHRLDNTIRYSNPGIRDIQHAAAMLFTRLITYDALYFKGTDAVSLYDGYGDVVGGIGSYPVLGSPHYHQASDLLEHENHQLITETSKTTVATLMLLASSPSRLTNLKVDSYTGGRGRALVDAEPRRRRHVVHRRLRDRRGSAAAPPRRHAAARHAAVRSRRARRVGEGGERARPRRMGLGQADAWRSARLLQRLQPLFQPRHVRIFGDEPLHDGGGAFLLTRRLERVGGQHAMADPKRAIVLRRLDAPQLLDRRARVLAIEQQRFRRGQLHFRIVRMPLGGERQQPGRLVRPSRLSFGQRPVVEACEQESLDVRGIAAADADASGIRVHQLAAMLAGFIQAEQPGEPDDRRGRVCQTPARRSPEERGRPLRAP